MRLVIWDAIVSIMTSPEFNGLVPEGKKPFLEPMSTNHLWILVAFNWWSFHKKSILYMSLGIINSILQPHLPAEQWPKIMSNWIGTYNRLFMSEQDEFVWDISIPMRVINNRTHSAAGILISTLFCGYNTVHFLKYSHNRQIDTA